jgi:plastocyanin
MNAFVIAGLVLAGWAVLVSLIGMRGFPSNLGGERAAIGITAILFVAAVGSAIADTTKVGERHGPEKPTINYEDNFPKPAGQGGGGAQTGGESSGGAAAGGGATGGGAAPLALSADPSGGLKFDKSALEAPAGKVTIVMTNPAPVPHDIAIKGDGANEVGEQVSNGGKSTVTADLKPGTYEFYCSVPGHEQAGMKGTLTVK